MELNILPENNSNLSQSISLISSETRIHLSDRYEDIKILLKKYYEKLLDPNKREREIQELVSQEEDDFSRGNEIAIGNRNYIHVAFNNLPPKLDTSYVRMQMQESFKQLETEEGLVTNTEATQYLENILKKVLINQGKSELANKIRICISSRRELLNASMYADGTIVISQYFINNLGSMDQLFGVLFHEVVHKEREHSGGNNAGVIDEVEADVLLTCEYLDQSGYNSKGLLKAIETIESLSDNSGASMGYLSFYQRRAMIREVHKRRHFVNSNKKETPLPELLISEATLTNLEIFKKLSDLQAIEELGELIANFTKENLRLLMLNTGDTLLFQESQLGENFSEVRKQIYPKICELITSRLRTFEDKVPEPLIKGVLTILDSYLGYKYDKNLPRRIYSQDELLASVFGYKNAQIFFRGIFGTDLTYSNVHFFNFISSNVRYSKSTTEEFKDCIPVEETKLIEIIENILDHESPGNYDAKFILQIIINYSAQIKIENPSELRKFLELIKNSRLSKILDSDTLIDALDDPKISYGSGKNYTKQELAHELLMRELRKYHYPESRRKYETSQGLGPERYDEDQEFVGILSEFFDIQNPAKIETETDPLIVISQAFSKITEKDTKGHYLLGMNRDVEYSTLFTRLNKLLKEKNLSEEEVFKLIEEIFKKIDSLPFTDPEFVRETSSSSFFRNKNLSQESINKTLLFSFKLRALIELSRNDSKLFYEMVNRIMMEAGDTFDSSSVYDLASILSPLLNNNTSGLSSGNFIGFNSTPTTVYESQQLEIRKGVIIKESDREPYPTIISDIQSLEILPLVRRFLDYPMPSVTLSGTPEDALKMITSEVFKIKGSVYTYLEQSVSVLDDNYSQQLLFSESLIASKLLQEYRKAYLEYIKNNEPNPQNYEQYFQLIKQCLPNSEERGLILRSIIEIYLHSEELTYEEKVEFAVENYRYLKYEDVLYLSELIPSDENNPGVYWENWLKFKASFASIWSKTKEIKREIGWIAEANSESQKAPIEALETAIMSQSSSAETSTYSANGWLRGIYYHKFLAESIKFAVTGSYRPYFRSLRDYFIFLKNRSLMERVTTTTTALTNEVRERGGRRIGEILTKIFDSDSDFLNEFISTASGTLEKGKSDFLITTMGYFSGKNLFQNLDIRNIDIVEVKKFLMSKFPNRNDLNNLTEEELRSIFDASTRSISLFGPQFQSSDSTIISPILQDNDSDYMEVMTHLTSHFNIDFYPAERTAGSEEEVHVPRNVENLIGALEMTILGTRGLQMSGQMYNFADPDIRRRVSRSFDANPGLDRIDFLLALDSASERDPVLNEFLRTRLIGIKRAHEGRDSLGGGSMATVYLAEVIDGETHKPVLSALRCLVPNAVENVNDMFTSLHSVFEKMEKRAYKLGDSLSKHRKIIRDSRIGKLILEIAKNWCIQDLEDPDYEVNDDRFREEVTDEFLRQNPSYDFVAPKRIYSSEAESEDDEGNKIKIKNWVRIESLAPGVTVRKFLESPEYSDDLKREVITQIYNFNMFQYNQIPGNGEDRLLQSDPSIGNYHIEIIDGKPRIHILDRGLMIKMDSERAELFRKFANEGRRSAGNGAISAVGEAYLSVSEKLQLLKLLIREVLKENNKNNRFVVSLNLLKSITNSVIFKEAREISDIVLAVNESFAELGLKIPISIQLPIKNITGWKMLMKEWSQK